MPDLLMTLYYGSDDLSVLDHQEGVIRLTEKRPESRVLFEFSVMRTSKILEPAGEGEFLADWEDLRNCTFRQFTS